MLIREFAQDSTDDELKAQIITVLEFLRNRAHDKKLMPTVGTQGLINMINNQIPGSSLTYETLKELVGSDQALKGLVDSVDRDITKLVPFGDEPGAPQEPEDGGTGEGGGAKDPTAIVDKMAKKASSKRADLA